MTNEEHIRHALLRTLYGTRTVKVASSFLERAAVRDCGCTAEEARAEIEFLKSAGLVSSTPDTLGSSHYWQITAECVLTYERTR